MVSTVLCIASVLMLRDLDITGAWEERDNRDMRLPVSRINYFYFLTTVCMLLN